MVIIITFFFFNHCKTLPHLEHTFFDDIFISHSKTQIGHITTLTPILVTYVESHEGYEVQSEWPQVLPDLWKGVAFFFF